MLQFWHKQGLSSRSIRKNSVEVLWKIYEGVKKSLPKLRNTLWNAYGILEIKLEQGITFDTLVKRKKFNVKKLCCFTRMHAKLTKTRYLLYLYVCLHTILCYSFFERQGEQRNCTIGISVQTQCNLSRSPISLVRFLSSHWQLCLHLLWIRRRQHPLPVDRKF